MVLTDGRAVEATWPAVRFTTLHDVLRAHDDTELRTIGPFTNPCGMPDEPDAYDVIEQVGKPYDVWGVLMMINPWRDWQEPDKWFCSELIAQAMPETFIDASRVTPQMLYILSKPMGVNNASARNS